MQAGSTPQAMLGLACKVSTVGAAACQYKGCGFHRKKIFFHKWTAIRWNGIAILLLHLTCSKGTAWGREQGAERTLFLQKPKMNWECKASHRVTKASFFNAVQFHYSLAQREEAKWSQWDFHHQLQKLCIRSISEFSEVTQDFWKRDSRSLQDELDFQEACPKLQGAPNAVATVWKKWPPFPHKAVGMDEFRHKYIPRGILYPSWHKKEG